MTCSLDGTPFTVTDTPSGQHTGEPRAPCTSAKRFSVTIVLSPFLNTTSPRVASGLDFYMGDARGRFEGDTLVVETRNIRPEAAYRNASENLVITERFTPIDASTLSWEVRFEDPDTWAATWSIEMPLKKETDAAPFEYACHEGNLGLRNILSAARATDAERAKE